MQLWMEIIVDFAARSARSTVGRLSHPQDREANAGPHASEYASEGAEAASWVSFWVKILWSNPDGHKMSWWKMFAIRSKIMEFYKKNDLYEKIHHHLWISWCKNHTFLWMLGIQPQKRWGLGYTHSRGNNPQMAEQFRLVKYYNLRRYIYIYIII